LEEIEFITTQIDSLGLQSASLEIDVTLARGLNYYTGAIFEVSAPDKVKMGSIGGGGRYDDLTGIFGLKDVSGVGISFGLDRIYLVMEELGLFSDIDLPRPQVLFINFGSKEGLYAQKAVQSLRKKGVSAELYPDSVKMKKQMNYANRRGIPFVVLTGDSEIAEDKYTLKNMNEGSQQLVNLADLIRLVNLK
jgi:histidyl-tRNA synthetase